MKQILAWIFIVFGILVLAGGTSNGLYDMVYKLKSHEQNTSWWGEHYTPNGDLVNMSYLDDIQTFNSPKDYKFTTPADTGNKNIDLYVWGDSYLEDVPSKAFAHINSYHFGRNYYAELHYKLNKNKRNILIIESAERFVRPYFIYRTIYQKVSKLSESPNLKAKANDTTHWDITHLFNDHINQNIEFLAFNYNFLNAPRRWKADMTYTLFHRASGGVVVSENGQNLFIKETILPKHGYSCYETLEPNIVHWYVNEFDSIYNHYKAEGFDEVYLSIIPNPASILQSARYNDLIPTIASDTSLYMPMINVYPQFKHDSSPRRLYRSGDSHWNNNGMQIWLQIVNEVLREESIKGSTH